jgi:hypothetical protein
MSSASIIQSRKPKRLPHYPGHDSAAGAYAFGSEIRRYLIEPVLSKSSRLSTVKIVPPAA